MNINEIREYVKNNSECELISNEYINTRTELVYKCNCGEEFSNTLSNFKRMEFKCCPNCRRIIKANIVKEEKYNKLKINIESAGCKLLTHIDNFIDLSTEVNVMCRCGNEYKIKAYLFNRSKQCQACGEKSKRDKHRTSNEKIIKLINENNARTGMTYKWIDDVYINAKTFLNIIDEDGYLYQTKYPEISRNDRDCILSKFHQDNPYTIQNINLWMKSNAIGYKLLSDKYTKAKDKLLWECPIGHKFEMNFDNFKQGQRCKECETTNGEESVLNWILLNNIDYEFQYSFDDCRGRKRPLPFDFAIFNDKNIIALIEYDGEMHYDVCRFISSKSKQLEKLKTQQHYDTIKNEYCKANNIHLLRIPYWEKKNISTILDNFYVELVS